MTQESKELTEQERIILQKAIADLNIYGTKKQIETADKILRLIQSTPLDVDEIFKEFKTLRDAMRKELGVDVKSVEENKVVLVSF